MQVNIYLVLLIKRGKKYERKAFTSRRRRFWQGCTGTAQKHFDCAFVDDGYETGTKINGAEVVGRISDIAKLFSEYQKLIVVIGNNALREKVYKEAAAIGYSFPNIIVNSAYAIFNGIKQPIFLCGTTCRLNNCKLNRLELATGLMSGDFFCPFLPSCLTGDYVALAVFQKK